MFDIVRDSTLGQVLNSVFGLFPYEDQRTGYAIPTRYLPSSTSLTTSSTIADEEAANVARAPSALLVPSATAYPSELKTLPEDSRRTSIADTFVAGQLYPGRDEQNDHVEDGLKKEQYNLDVTPGAGQLDPPAKHPEYVIVSWNGDDDQDNPRNWSLLKRSAVAGQIMLLTFAVYTGSAIYTASIPGLMEHFGVSAVHATWGLSLFVLAYGIGPMFLSPVQDMMQVGRNPVYVLGLFVFTVFQLPIIFAPNMSTVLAFRFLTGFVGSPALATGGASMGDIFPPHRLPYVIGLWAIGAVCGPITGPVIGNFAAAARGWKWPILELEWIAAFAFVVLFAFLPETLESNILHKRANRLRKLTGNKNLRTLAEIEAEGFSTTSYLLKSFARPLELAFKPAVLFANVYIGLAYAIFYLWFEAFPIVFNDIHGFRQGVSGLPYLAFIVSATVTFTFYCLYQKYHIEPRFIRNGGLAPEVRLEVALIGGICIPISLFIFGWTSRADVPWIFPIIGAAIYLPGIYLMFQGILIYLSMSYPKDAGSILAVNDLFRSTVASFFPLFGRTFFTNLGVGPGSSLLAGLSIALIPVLYGFIRWGHKLRPQEN